MQTDAAHAPISQQKPQHWINQNHINKKTNRILNTFFRKIPLKKREEKHNADTNKVKSTIQENTGGKGKQKRKEVRWRRDLERHAQQDFGRGSAGQTWKVRVKEMQVGDAFERTFPGAPHFNKG